MSDQSSNTMWKPYIGYLPTTLALPDYYANYFGYAFHWEGQQNVGLRITGEFGYARYMSYNIYDMVSGASLGSLKDVDIVTEGDNVNPFLPASNPDATSREYTVNVFCSDSVPPPSPPPPPLINPLSFKVSDDVGILLVILRYYLPTDNAGNQNDEAGVPLPTIEAFDMSNNNSPLPQLPQNLAISKMPTPLYRERLSPIFSTIVDRTLRFYHAVGTGQYNNQDNLYLITAVEKGPDEVLLINLQAPEYAHINADNESADVRYWSFNQGNANTSTPNGKADHEFQVAKDGRVYIAMGDESIEEHATNSGYNFMLWEATSPRAVILYRNLVTSNSFAGSIEKVAIVTLPFCNPDDVMTYDAVNYIGEYAPTGQKVLKQEFLNNSGGFASPGFKD